MRSRDTFSRLEIAQEAQRIVAQCVTEASQFRGGNVVVGPMGEFFLVVCGVREAVERKNLERVR